MESWFGIKFHLPFETDINELTPAHSIYIDLHIQSNYTQILGLFMKWNRCIEGECLCDSENLHHQTWYILIAIHFEFEHWMCECKHNVFDDFPNIKHEHAKTGFRLSLCRKYALAPLEWRRTKNTYHTYTHQIDSTQHQFKCNSTIDIKLHGRP